MRGFIVSVYLISRYSKSILEIEVASFESGVIELLLSVKHG